METAGYWKTAKRKCPNCPISVWATTPTQEKDARQDCLQEAIFALSANAKSPKTKGGRQNVL